MGAVMQANEQVPVTGFGPGFFRVGEEVHRGAMLLTRSACLPWGGLGDHAALLALAGEVDVVIIGTGPEMAFLPPELQDALDAAGIGVEPMATKVALRSYNMLLGDGRRIALAALPV